jgi:hypothetical protein
LSELALLAAAAVAAASDR